MFISQKCLKTGGSIKPIDFLYIFNFSRCVYYNILVFSVFTRECISDIQQPVLRHWLFTLVICVYLSEQKEIQHPIPGLDSNFINPGVKQQDLNPNSTTVIYI